MRPASFLGVAAIGWYALVAGPAFGQDPDDVDRVESLAEQADFDHAEVAATRALSQGSLPPAAAARVYVVLGTIAAARGNPEDAEAFFRKALVLNPRAVLQPSAGPHVRASFSRARAALAEEEPPRAPPVPPKQEAPPPPEVRARPVPASVWIGVATTGALTVGAVVLGVVALDRRATFETANADPEQTVAHRSALRDTALNLEHAATITAAAILVSATLTSILYVTRPAESARLSVSALPAVSGGTLLLSGHF